MLESFSGQRPQSCSKLRNVCIFKIRIHMAQDVMTGMVMSVDVAVGGQNGPLFIRLCIVCLPTSSVAQALHRRRIGRSSVRLLKRCA